MQQRKGRYTRLYHDVMRAVDSSAETKSRVIRQRAEQQINPSIKNIAKECDVSLAVVSSYLIEFKKEIFQQLEYSDLIAR